MIALINATTNQIPLPDNSVHCVVTSPPYWGLRDYGLPPSMWGDTWRGCLGLEPTPGMYVEHMVEVFREVKRVLRDDGSVWLNLGDSYASQPSWGRGASSSTLDGGKPYSAGVKRELSGLKPKDLVGIPWRVAFALQADGWWLRSDIIWSKTNPMPESVTDRPTKAHEYVFLLTKRARYFYDADAVREAMDRSVSWEEYNNLRKNRWGGKTGSGADTGQLYAGAFKTNKKADGTKSCAHPAGRNRRTVWTISTKPYAGAHFATYPPALVEPCIKAGTSERGVCPECGGPWERVVERTGHINKREPPHVPNNSPTKTDSTGWALVTMATNSWRPTCTHYPETDLWQEYPRQGRDESDDDYTRRMEPIRQERQRLLALWEPMETVPATVLDPFVGSGTTLMVARALGRHGIGLDLSFDYLSRQARKRLELHKLTAWATGSGGNSSKPLNNLPLFTSLEEPEP